MQNKYAAKQAPEGKATGSAMGKRMSYKAGSHFAKLEDNSSVTAFVSKQELAFLRETLQGLAGCDIGLDLLLGCVFD